MAVIAKYACIAMPGVNAIDKLAPDSGGYRKVVVGAFDTYNSVGEYYPLLPSVRKMFDSGGIVRRRLDTGFLRGEYGHPRVAGLSLEDAIRRLIRIDEKSVSHHFKSITLQDGVDERGSKIVLVVGEVKPTGPYEQTLDNHFKNPDENVAFSVRSLTDTKVMNGRKNKIILDALTWDYVNEPGIKNATQYNSVGLEEIQDNLIFTEADLNRVIESSNHIGLENDYSALTMVRSALGWEKVQVIKVSAIDWQ